jgi:putative FmdB family regulatory protein
VRKQSRGSSVPLYEYQCKACKHIFEKIQLFSAPLITKCPECGKEEVEQMLSAPAIKFKGSGWYVNDYAKKGSKSGSSSGSSSEGSSDIKSESKSEAKSEGKSESKSESKSEPKKS